MGNAVLAAPGSHRLEYFVFARQHGDILVTESVQTPQPFDFRHKRLRLDIGGRFQIAGTRQPDNAHAPLPIGV